MKVIGHRGAAGLAPENTLEAIKAALRVGVDAIECDIRLTKDGYIVLHHDETTLRMCGVDKKIQNMTLREIQKLRTTQGSCKIPTLDEALTAAGDMPLFIEAKDSGWAESLAIFLRDHPKQAQCRVISFNHRELFALLERVENVKAYGLERNSPLDALRTARVLGFTGVDLNFWLLNPLTYWLARLHHLEIIVYTVNRPWIARFMRVFFPNISITSDVPHQLQHFRTK